MSLPGLSFSLSASHTCACTLARRWQFGWSTYIGSAPKQLQAQSQNKGFKLNAWEHKGGRAFYKKHMSDLLPAAWKVMVERYPKMCDAMLKALPPEYRLQGTGFSKVTIAINNPVRARTLPAQLTQDMHTSTHMCDALRTPQHSRRLTRRGFVQTPLHFDDNNFGLTFLISFDLNDNLEPGSGSHVLCSTDGAVAMQVHDSAHGVVCLGDYRRVLHSNRAVTTSGGERLIVTAYCSQTLVDLVKASQL